MKKIFAGLLFLCITFSCQAKSAILYHWLQLGPENHWLAKVITTNDQCPSIKTASNTLPMDILHTKNKNFPVTICQTILPNTTQSASVENYAFSLPKPVINKILVLGDTGCRMKKGIKPQDCDRLTHWPFPLIAKNAAAFKPDLVIHVGDYLYRESLGYPHGDNWLTWNIDFFKPVKPLLQSAPVIFVRGNHENCERAGEGWTKLLDPFGFKHCFNHSPVYTVSIGGNTTLAIMDSANANDFVAPANEVAVFENYLQSIEKNTDQPTWLITHKPFWFVFDDDELTQTYANHVMNTLETAWENISPQNLGVIISGHVHRLQTLNFAKDRPPQIIVGASGTSLDGSLDRTALKGLTASNEPITEGISLIEFGYMTMERKDNVWTAQMRNLHGKILENCTLKDKKFSCTATTLESRLETKQLTNRAH